MTAAVERAHAAFARRAWAEACDAFTVAADEGAMTRADHEAMAVAAYLVGADDRSERAWEAAYRNALDDGNLADAARCGFWLAFGFMMRGQMAQAGGWLGRVEELVGKVGECPAAGYLRIPALLQALDAGDAAAARDHALAAIELGTRFTDHDLRAFGVLGLGQSLIALGEIADGTSQLDRVMVSVKAGDVGPVASGIVYCAVTLKCMAMYDIARAREWTDALGRWCDAQPDLVPYRGQCLVHQSQLQTATGRWAEAAATIKKACERLADPPHPALGLAHYQEAELHRLAGALDDADAAYRNASRHGQQPMPGLALLDLARGDAAAATAAIRRVLDEPGNPSARPTLLAAAVDIEVAAGDVTRARSAVDELVTLAASSTSPLLHAMAAHATGAVLLAEGDASGALAQLRPASTAWRTLQMPYEAARTAALIGRACADLGDRTTATIELENARATFESLGARPDAERLAEPGGGSGSVLSERELEVLAHLAAGATNRQIAASLLISQHTVGRHVENIFSKLGVTTRAAATAYAYEHGLIDRQR